MYLASISLSLGILYIILFLFLPELCNQEKRKIEFKSFISIALIFVLSLFGYGAAFAINDIELSNRFLHGFGGGFMAFLVCFLVVRDTRIKISKFQFFILSLLIVTTLGVANEILEFYLQNYAGFIFALTINDTWLDLISNGVGGLLAALCLTHFLPETEVKNN